MPYQHPGHAFIKQQGPLQRDADLAQYGSFLREAAGLSDEPPIDLKPIYQHFEMPLPRLAPLIEQQGILVDAERGLILIKADDPEVRQRFTEGHELLELLFEAQAQQATGWQVRGERKERLCDRGAAALLMPAGSFKARLANLGVSVATAQALAKDYHVSLLATLMRMMQLGEGAHCLVVWRLGWQTAAEKQAGRQPPQLRVWWRSAAPAWLFSLPVINHVAKPDSVVAIAQRMDQFLTGTEPLPTARPEPSSGVRQETKPTAGAAEAFSERCSVEALPLRIGRRRCVVSLFHAL